LLNSAISSIPETFGVDPTARAVQFRRDHPWLGVGSELAGMAIPYTGWFKAAKGVGYLSKAGKAVEAVTGGVKASPVLTTALKSMAAVAPFEAGRTAISTMTGDNTGQIATDAATNLALAGAFGTVGGMIKSAGPRVPSVPEISKEVNLSDPIPLQLRKLKEAHAAGTVTNPDAAKYWINRYTDFVRREDPRLDLPDGTHKEIPFVGQLEGDVDTQRLNRLFRTPRNATAVKGRRLVPEDFETDGSYNDALAKSGLVGKEDFIQFPRLVEATGKGVGHIESTVTSTLSQVSPDTWMAKEANDGLYVMAKRVEAADAIRGKKGVPGTEAQHKWVLFKTDSPSQFAPLGDAWTKTLEGAAKFAPDTNAPIGTDMNNAYQSMLANFPLRNFNDTVTQGRTGQFLQDLKQKLGFDRMSGSLAQVGRNTYDFAKAHVAPAMFQFGKSPRASYIFNMARNMYHFADANTQKIMQGDAKISHDHSLFNNVLNGVKSSGEHAGAPALGPLIDKLEPQELREVWLARAEMWDPERVKQAVISGEISPGSGEMIRALNAVDTKQFADVTKTQEAFDLPVSKPALGHMMISNTWKGSIRVPVLDADGKLVTLASGRNRNEAISEARSIVEGGSKQGFNWKEGNWFHADPTTELQQLMAGGSQNKIDLGSRQFSVANALRIAAQRAKMRPVNLRENTGVGGYVGEYTPWSKQELKDIVETKVRSMQRYQAQLHVENALGPEMIKLANENPALYKQLLMRMDDLAGRPQASAQWQNRVADQSPLGAMLGSNSASKAVAGLNSITHHMQLGMGNITFPILNALSPLMTALPHAAFVLKAAPEDLQRMGYYSWNMVGDAAGKPRGSAGLLNIARLAKQSFAEMGKPSNELSAHLAQAAHEGAWSNTFNQEVVGPEAAIGHKLRGALEGKDGLVGMLTHWSNLLPNISERFARVQSFSLGHIIGRDMLQLKGDDLYRFAKRFTENSNFAYGTADRARVITGPMGSLWGLYKNWQMHYAGWMLEYLNQGVNHGNWSPLLLQALGTGATGGIGSLAGFSALDGLSKLTTDKDLMQHVYDNFGPTGTDGQKVSDAVYFGLPAFLGASLQGSATEPGANPVRDAAMMFSLVQWDRMKALGGAMGNAWDQYQVTGDNPLRSPMVRDNVYRALAPRSVYRSVAAMQDGDFIRSLNTGYPTAKASVGEKVLYALGLNPVDVEKQMIVSDKLWRDQDAMKNAVQAYGKALMAAEGDPDAIRAVMLRAMADGVPIDSVIKSQKSRSVRSERSPLDRQFQPLKVKGYEDVLGKK
jgi:hypothetical protein